LLFISIPASVLPSHAKNQRDLPGNAKQSRKEFRVDWVDIHLGVLLVILLIWMGEVVNQVSQMWDLLIIPLLAKFTAMAANKPKV
jgi:hypothetical protein